MDLDRAKSLVRLWLERSGSEREQLLPLLHHLQHEIGYVDDRLVATIAAAFNLSRADVHGVLTFYPDFRNKPLGRHLIQFCRAESCQARGGIAIEKFAARRLGVSMGETRGDGQVSLQPVYCLGLCAIGPNALVDGQPVAGLDIPKIDQIAAEVGA